MKSIRRWLLVSLLLGALAFSLIAAYGIFHTMQNEAAELFDYELRTVAVSLPENINMNAYSEYPAEAFQGIADDRILIAISSLSGVPVYRSSDEFPLQIHPPAGFVQQNINGKPWRIFGLRQAQRYIVVGQPMSVREDLALKLAWRALWPLALLIPAIILWVLFVVRQGLRPMARLSAQLDKHLVQALTPLPEAGVPAEMRPLVVALNGLLVRLNEASRAQHIFIGDAAHALRTPLTALQLQIQGARAEGSLRGEEQTLQGLELRLNRLIHLAAQLLAMAREDANGGVNLASVSLKALAEQSVADLSLQAEQRGVDLGLECFSPLQGDVFQLCADRHALMLLLDNLLDNAVRHTPRGGRVDLVLERHAALIDICVRDEGSGIAPHELSRVLDRFYRGEGASGIGSGLGLAIVASIAQRHGVTLSLRNRDERSGLIVTLQGFSAEPSPPGA